MGPPSWGNNFHNLCQRVIPDTTGMWAALRAWGAPGYLGELLVTLGSSAALQRHWHSGWGRQTVVKSTAALSLSTYPGLWNDERDNRLGVVVVKKSWTGNHITHVSPDPREPNDRAPTSHSLWAQLSCVEMTVLKSPCGCPFSFQSKISFK